MNLTLSDAQGSLVFVPTQDILLTEAVLPKLSKYRLSQALPYALEEKVIADVSELHFAVGPYQKEHYPVAVIAKTKMAEWLASLNAQELFPDRLVPSVFLLPFEEGRLYINCYQGQCLVRTGEFSGFACEENNLETLLKLKKVDQTSISKTEYSPEELLDYYQKRAPGSVINLLQDTFAPKPQMAELKKQLRLSAYLGGACVVTLFLSLFVSYFMLNARASNYEREIQTIYQKHFPQSKSFVAPKERMQEKLNKVTGNAHKNNILGWLTIIAKNNQMIHINNADFREDTLNVDVSTASFENLSTFISALKKEGLQVKQQTAATEGQSVKAMISIRGGSA